MAELSFTRKEIETAGMLAAGFRRIDVAQQQGVSINTVKARIDTLLFKTYARNTAHMVHVLTKRGLLILLICLSTSNDVDGDKMRRHTRLRTRPVPTRLKGKS